MTDPTTPLVVLTPEQIARTRERTLEELRADRERAAQGWCPRWLHPTDPDEYERFAERHVQRACRELQSMLERFARSRAKRECRQRLKEEQPPCSNHALAWTDSRNGTHRVGTCTRCGHRIVRQKKPRTQSSA